MSKHVPRASSQAKHFRRLWLNPQIRPRGRPWVTSLRHSGRLRFAQPRAPTFRPGSLGHGLAAASRVFTGRTSRVRSAEGEWVSALFVLVECTWKVDYRLAEGHEPAPESVKALKDGNAIFNGWPYLPECVQESVARRRQPPLTIPLLRLPPKPSGQEPFASEQAAQGKRAGDQRALAATESRSQASGIKAADAAFAAAGAG